MARIESTEAAQVIAGGGAAGGITYDSGATGLTFGVGVSPGATKDIVLSGDGTGESYSVRLVFSGTGIAGFNIPQFVKNGTTYVRPTPFEPSGGEDFVIGFDKLNNDTGSITVRFTAEFTTGLAEAMTVEIYNAGTGVLIDTIIATATVIDPVIAAVKSDPNYLGFWSASGVNTGLLLDGDVVFREQTGKYDAGTRDIEAVFAINAWHIVNMSPPGSAPSMSSYLVTDERGPTAYAIIRNLIGAFPTTGIAFVRTPGGSAQWTGNNIGFVSLDGGVLGAPVSVSSSGVRVNQSPVFFAQGHNHTVNVTPPTEWFSIAWATSTGTGGTTTVYVSQVGAAFGGLASSHQGSIGVSSGDLGLNLMFNNTFGGASVDDAQLAGIALSSGIDIGTTWLEAVHNAAA